MKTTQYNSEILQELTQVAERISNEEVETLVTSLLQSQHIFVAGAGRSGLMMRSFAMRLMHIGLHVYVVGETATPSLTKDDLFIVGTGSGETKSLVAMVEKAKSLEAQVAAITINPNSTIGQYSNVMISIPASPKEIESSGVTIQPMGSLFEQSLLLLLDAVVLRIAELTEVTFGSMSARHANLE